MNQAEFANALARFGFRPEEIDEQFVRASGPGGQKVNKVATAVMLRLRGQGLMVRAGEARSQRENRSLARARLIESLERVRTKARLTRAAARSKQRRQLAQRSESSKRAMVEAKRRRAWIKAGRGRARATGYGDS